MIEFGKKKKKSNVTQTDIRQKVLSKIKKTKTYVLIENNQLFCQNYPVLIWLDET